MGQFVHVIRRNLNMVYLVMNNGCYGLTKGQDSATADAGSKNKSGSVNPFESIDLASLALELGATFVAQSFSGDKEQLVPLMKAAMKHQGFAFINVISPCVTFNNNVGSTKSYDYVREHVEMTATVDFIPEMHEITASYKDGAVQTVRMHDGSTLRLRKLEDDWDPLDRMSAMIAVQHAKEKGEILTGLLYMQPETEDLQEILHTSARPLNSLTQAELCPGSAALEKLNAALR
jgi:2-oxoglutarate ferredoxin oxidoreductase subunit beta